MKAKVICGRQPLIGGGRIKKRIDPWEGNRGVVVTPARRSSNLVLATLDLIARKIRAKG
ncbi:MAG: hypothetical protein JOZ31_18060 [Verrucomicrobia bacterium]|nr:hypothetical protein [Verrucomicrobiota bacterium]MBV8481751.1 hypothetical protein [Verrucomicrobiota bacterium]